MYKHATNLQPVNYGDFNLDFLHVKMLPSQLAIYSINQSTLQLQTSRQSKIMIIQILRVKYLSLEFWNHNFLIIGLSLLLYNEFCKKIMNWIRCGWELWKTCLMMVEHHVHPTLKVQICGIGNINNYRNANGEQRQSMTVHLPTKQRLQRGILFDVSKDNVLSYGGTFMLINVILLNDLKTIVMTTRSKVLKTDPF